MKTLVGITTEALFGRDGKMIRPASGFQVISVDHNGSFDLAKDLPGLVTQDFSNVEGSITQIIPVQGDRRDISEIILTYFLEKEFSGTVEHFAFDPQSGATDVSDLGESGLGIAVTMQEIPRSRDMQTPDFFDLLRELHETLTELSECLRGINDPVLKDSRVAQVLAAIGCLSIYTNPDDDTGLDKIPGSIVANAKKELTWSAIGKLSDRVANLSNSAAKLLDALIKWVPNLPFDKS